MKKANFLLIFSMFLLLSLAAAAQASPLFPFAPGYTATYSGSQGSLTWTWEMQITGTVNLEGYQWLVANLTNFTGDGTTKTTYWRVTDTAFYELGVSGPDFQIGPLHSSWPITWPYGYDPLTTGTIVAIGSVTVPAGTFSNVYEVHLVNPTYTEDEYMYWKPGVGLIKGVEYSGDLATNPVTRVLVQVEGIGAVPLPPAIFLFGTSLVGLAAFRKKFKAEKITMLPSAGSGKRDSQP